MSALLDMGRESDIKYTVIIRDDTKAFADNVYYQRLKEYEAQGLCQVVAVPSRPISLRHHFSLSRFIDCLDGDIYLYPHFDLPLSVRTPAVAVIHDLTMLRFRKYITRYPLLKTIYFRLMLRMTARKAKFVFAVSETTRKDFLTEVGRNFSDKVGVCLEGAAIRSNPTGSDPLPSFMPSDHFLLYVGDRLPHKNLKRIIDLFKLLKAKGFYLGSLLLVGSTKNHDFDLDSYIAGREDIQVVGQVDDTTLTFLYQRMDALVILSKYEGFGLPVVEAGLMKKKMIVSDGGSLPEVAPPWAFVVPNNCDLSSLLLKIKDYLDNPVAFDESYGKDYTWPRVARCVRNKFLELTG